MTVSNSLQGNPEAAQAGCGITFSNKLVFIAQTAIQDTELFAVGRFQSVIQYLAEEGDAIVRSPGNRQTTTKVTEVGAGAAEIRGGWFFPFKKISKQVGQSRVMSAASAACTIASGTCFSSVNLAEQLIESKLGYCYHSKPPFEPFTLRDAERGNLEVDSLQKRRPVGRIDVKMLVHKWGKKRHRAISQVPQSNVVGENRKPGSVPRSSYPQRGDDHSSRTAVADGLKQPDPGVSDGPSSSTPLFGLAPDGVYRAADVTVGTGELLPHPFTLTSFRLSSNGRSSLCGTFPGVAPGPR